MRKPRAEQKPEARARTNETATGRRTQDKRLQCQSFAKVSENVNAIVWVVWWEWLCAEVSGGKRDEWYSDEWCMGLFGGGWLWAGDASFARIYKRSHEGAAAGAMGGRRLLVSETQAWKQQRMSSHTHTYTRTWETGKHIQLESCLQ